jgi:hypothetical protein
MQPPSEKKKPWGWCPKVKGKESSLTNPTTAKSIAQRPRRGKKNSSFTPTLFGLPSGNLLVIPCGLCGQVHLHWWGINTSRTKDLRYAHCIDPEVERYYVAKAPKSKLARVTQELKDLHAWIVIEHLVPGSKAYFEEKRLKDEWRAWRDAMKGGNGRAS